MNALECHVSWGNKCEYVDYPSSELILMSFPYIRRKRQTLEMWAIERFSAGTLELDPRDLCPGPTALGKAFSLSGSQFSHLEHVGARLCGHSYCTSVSEVH